MVKRRRFVQSAATLSGISLVGCLGDDDSADDASTDDSADGDSDDVPGDGVDWPPPRDLVDLKMSSVPGGTTDIIGRIVWSHLGPYLEGDVTTSFSYMPDAGGLLKMNEMAALEPDGRALGIERANTPVLLQLLEDQADFDIRDFNAFMQISRDTRAIQLNPNTMPVDDHFEMSWEEFQDIFEERDTVTVGVPNPGHTVKWELVRAFDPVIGDTLNVVEMPGGSEVRAGMERGDIDFYAGSFVSNITSRNDVYYTQFVWLDPDRMPEFAETVFDVLPEASPTASREEKTLRENQHALMSNQDAFPEEETAMMIDYVSDGYFLYLAPDTHDEIIDKFIDAAEQMVDDPEYHEAYEETFDPADNNPDVGRHVQDVFDDTYDTLIGNDEVRSLIEEHLN